LGASEDDNGQQTGAMLLSRAVMTLVSCAVLVTFCYFFVDRPVAYYIHARQINKSAALERLTHIPMAFDVIAPIVLVLAAVKRAWAPWTRLDRTLVAASVSLVIAVFFEHYLKILFGRYWPETWVEDNPSLIGNGSYGFHLFHAGPIYGSFPSGHTARAFAALSVIAGAYPMWRWPCLAVCGFVMAALVGMDYHFVGDTIGGAALGTLTGMYALYFFQLEGQSLSDLPQSCSRAD
jgi:membrane-associated phospholipid phosphatase